MPNIVNINDFQNIEAAISAYAHEMYTDARRITSTGIIGDIADIRGDGESFIGQLRWYKPLEAVWNKPSFTDVTDLDFTDLRTEVATYIKSMHAYGMRQHNLQEMITKEDGLEKFARDRVYLQGEREHDAVLSTLRGVAASEAAYADGGIVDFDGGLEATQGMFIDLNAGGVFGAPATDALTSRRLINPDENGAARGERLFQAIGMAWQEYESEYYYLLTSPAMTADLRAANLIDEDRITDGNLQFSTLLGGKFRLIATRANQGNFSAAAGVNDQSTKTSFVVRPGAIVFKPLAVPVPFEIDRDATKYRGSGTTTIVSRFGFISHPVGYSWVGPDADWADNPDLATGANWVRKWDPLNLPILPIFHS